MTALTTYGALENWLSGWLDWKLQVTDVALPTTSLDLNVQRRIPVVPFCTITSGSAWISIADEGFIAVNERWNKVRWLILDEKRLVRVRVTNFNLNVFDTLSEITKSNYILEIHFPSHKRVSLKILMRRQIQMLSVVSIVSIAIAKQNWSVVAVVKFTVARMLQCKLKFYLCYYNVPYFLAENLFI